MNPILPPTIFGGFYTIAAGMGKDHLKRGGERFGRELVFPRLFACDGEGGKER